MAIKCPKCGSSTTVSETRWSGDRARRRRVCRDVRCGTKVSTIEIVVATRKGGGRAGDVQLGVGSAAVGSGLVVVRRLDVERVQRSIAILVAALQESEDV